MSISVVPLIARFTAAPKDHSWYSVDETVPFFAQATLPVNTWKIPPYDNIAITNDGNGNPIQYNYSKNSTIVATLSCTYDGNGYLTNIQQTL